MLKCLNPRRVLCSSSVTYTPASGAGTHTVQADYNEASSLVHATSFGTDAITVHERSTSTSVDCSAALTINETGTCIATVDDIDNGAKSAPSGTVTFTLEASGSAADAAGRSRGGATCTLVATDADSSAGAVNYKPTATAGTHRIKGTYDESSSALHASSNASDNIAVRLRTTSTALACTPVPAQINATVTCTATVKDIDPVGTKSSPTGTVSFTRDTVAQPPVCTLVPTGSDTSACTKTFTSSSATV